MDDAGLWPQLIYIAFGWLLSSATSYLTGRQSAGASAALARAQRRYEVGRDAYKAAVAAIDLGYDIASQQRTPTPQEALQLVGPYYTAITDARTSLGLPTSTQLRGDLIDAFFIVQTTIQRGANVNQAQARAYGILGTQRDEITAAWQHIVEGQ